CISWVTVLPPRSKVVAFRYEPGVCWEFSLSVLVGFAPSTGHSIRMDYSRAIHCGSDYARRFESGGPRNALYHTASPEIRRVHIHLEGQRHRRGSQRRRAPGKSLARVRPEE